MSYKCVMALDPGGTTGVALRAPDGDIVTATCKTPEELWEMLLSPGLEQVVFEKFQAQRIDKYGLYTVRLIGGIEALCYQRKLPVTAHMPSERRPFLVDAHDVLAGRRTVIHEKDAVAHLLRWEHDNGYRQR